MGTAHFHPPNPKIRKAKINCVSEPPKVKNFNR